MGGEPVPGFPEPGTRMIALPPVKAAPGFSGLLNADGEVLSEQGKAHRRELLLSAMDEFMPEVVMTEAYPFARRQMRFELVPMIERARRMQPRPLIVSSIRDILQEKDKPKRSEEAARIAQDCFDLILVHGDPAFARLEESFPLASRFPTKIVYTGLVGRATPAVAAEHYDVVVSAGGGAAGARLIEDAVNAAKLLPLDLRWCVIAGPNAPEDQLRSVMPGASSNLKIFTFRQDFPGLLAGAQVSVSQAGYNTVCDLLQAKCRSVLVPFAAGGETEQTTRASRLEALGLASVLPESGLSAARLADAVVKSLRSSAPAASRLNLDGALNTAAILRERLKWRASQK
jgi:predicted glycosyltransferase